MDMIASILGIGILLFLLMYTAFKLDEQHTLLKFLLFMLFLFGLIFLPKAMLDDSDYCSIEVNTSTVTYNTTAYTYMRTCTTNPHSTPELLTSFVTWSQRLVVTYLLLFLAWRALLFLKWVVPKDKGARGVIRFKFKRRR